MTAALKAVLFDLDGTLIDSAPDLAGAGNEMREARGLEPLPFLQFRPMVGAGARGMLGIALQVTPEHAEFPELRDEFLRRYEQRMTRETLPFDTRKLDRAVVSRLGATRSSAPLVRAIADLGAALELEVVAEGIETEMQVAELRRLGVRRGQGAFFRPPLEPRRIEELVGRGRRTRPTAA